MESDQSGINLRVAKQKFVSLLSTLSTGDDKDFLDWVIEQYSMLLTGDGSYACGNKSIAPFYEEYLNGEQKLLSIKEDLCSQLPIDGSCSSETVYQPEVGKVKNCFVLFIHLIINHPQYIIFIVRTQIVIQLQLLLLIHFFMMKMILKCYVIKISSIEIIVRNVALIIQLH